MGSCMCSYLSEPITDKESTDESNDILYCGASSMQGWRKSQEDAHNCILDYDVNTSFFAVYDGHGGHEVAQYCSRELPDFIKNTPEYKDGKIEEALTTGFLQFDALIATPDVVNVLKQIAAEKTNVRESDDEEIEEEIVKNLYEEAALPIQQVIKKYTANLTKTDKTKKDDEAASCSSSQIEEKSDSTNEASVSVDESSQKLETNGSEKASECDNEPTSSDSKVDSTQKEPQNGEISEAEANSDVTSSSGPVENGTLVKKEKWSARSIREGPGSDSGCTAVVALLKGTDLYVANAGDSRCIVCRSGKAIEMSLDHKPEDEAEIQRITKAGGEVTHEGRVNDGLNLSRAIGDHAYKQNKQLSDREQMITALPDVKKLTITPGDEFMVLACDGIWNSMSSQEVVDFVRQRVNEGREKMSQICEEIFDNCLATSLIDDSEGCDNMTAIIVKFKRGGKRPGTPLPDQVEAKRAKTDADGATHNSTV